MHLKILIADDHEIVREGVRALLQHREEWQVCGEAANGRDAVSEAGKLEPDIIVMDIGMPDMNGLEATRQIKRILPKCEVLIFTANETEEIVRSVFKAGARAYLLKSEANQHLALAVEALCKHRTYFSSKVSELVFAGYIKDGKDDGDSTLTAREREIVQLVAEGKSSKEIGLVLGIGLKTVETHRTAILRKLDLGSVADVVRYAIRNGIVTA
jgi:DNA-binding NarL/FixJ family response regulator